MIQWRVDGNWTADLGCRKANAGPFDLQPLAKIILTFQSNSLTKQQLTKRLNRKQPINNFYGHWSNFPKVWAARLEKESPERFENLHRYNIYSAADKERPKYKTDTGNLLKPFLPNRRLPATAALAARTALAELLFPPKISIEQNFARSSISPRFSFS